MYHVLYLMNKFITLLIFIIIPDNMAVSSGFEWLLVRDTAVVSSSGFDLLLLLGRDTAVAATHGRGSGGVVTSVSNDRTIN